MRPELTFFTPAVSQRSLAGSPWKTLHLTQKSWLQPKSNKIWVQKRQAGVTIACASGAGGEPLPRSAKATSRKARAVKTALADLKRAVACGGLGEDCLVA